jgi:hypothetical protein
MFIVIQHRLHQRSLLGISLGKQNTIISKQQVRYSWTALAYMQILQGTTVNFFL